MTYPTIATGSIVRLTVPGSRSTDGQPAAIPAIVLSQFPEDGILRLFCFHFEGQFMSTAHPEDVEVLFDADGVLPRQLADLRVEMATFQEQVLGMLMAQAPQSSRPAPSDPAPFEPSAPNDEPPIMASESDLAQVLDTLKSENRKLKSKGTARA